MFFLIGSGPASSGFGAGDPAWNSGRSQRMVPLASSAAPTFSQPGKPITKKRKLATKGTKVTKGKGLGGPELFQGWKPRGLSHRYSPFLTGPFLFTSEEQ
jgi:hypothetical protein